MYAIQNAILRILEVALAFKELIVWLFLSGAPSLASETMRLFISVEMIRLKMTLLMRILLKRMGLKSKQ